MFNLQKLSLVGLLFAVLLINPACTKKAVEKETTPAAKTAQEGPVPPKLDINHRRLPTVVFYYADWCPYCRYMQPILEKQQKKFKNKIYFHSVNVDQEKAFTAKYRLKQGGIPYFQFYDKKGNFISDASGAMQEDALIGKLVYNFNLL